MKNNCFNNRNFNSNQNQSPAYCPIPPNSQAPGGTIMNRGPAPNFNAYNQVNYQTQQYGYPNYYPTTSYQTVSID